MTTGSEPAAAAGTSAEPTDQPTAEESWAQVLAENARPSRGMIIWWNLLRPDRLATASALEGWAKDYDRADCREGGRALRDAARMIRASAGGPDA